jgi:hypothetical protein
MTDGAAQPEFCPAFHSLNGQAEAMAGHSEIGRLMVHVDAEAMIHGVDRVTDTDPRVQEQLEAEAREAVTQSLLERQDPSPEAETFVGRLFREQETRQAAGFQVAKRHIAEQALKTRIAGLLLLHQSAIAERGSDAAEKHMTAYKKQLMADMLAEGDSYSNGWFGLVNDVVPGAPLDLHDGDRDDPYLEEAFVRKEQADQYRNPDTARFFLDAVYGLVGASLDDYGEDNRKRLCFGGELAQSAILASQSETAAGRQSSLRTLAGQHSLGEGTIRRIIELTEITYPL